MQHLPFAHFHPGCSLLLISMLNSHVNKTCWQHVTTCDIKTVYIKTWFKFGSPGFPIRLQRGYATSVSCLTDLVYTKRSPTPVEGSEWKVEKCNRYALMGPYSLSLVLITEQKGSLSVLHMCNVCVAVLCDFKSACGNERGGLQQLLHPVTTMWQ